MPFVEFAYNRTVHSTIDFSPFEIVYGFNSLTFMDIILLPFKERVSLDGEKKAKIVGQLHEEVRLQIEKKNRLYTSKANTVNRSFSNPVIGFGCTYVRNDFLTKGNQNFSLMVRSISGFREDQ